MVDANDFPNPAANDGVGSLTNTTPRYLMQVGDPVPCVGAHVAMVLADSAAHARYASKCVQLVFTPSIMDASAELGASTRMSAHAFKASAEHLASRGNAPKMGLHVDLLDKATAASRAVERAHEGVGEPWSDEPHWRVVHGRPPAEWQAAAQAAAQVAARSATSGARSQAATTATAPLVLNGTFATGGQKHFYLETQAAFAIPSEDGKMVVWAGNQNPRRTQTSIASALGVPINKVDARVRRVGGAYGGKLNAHLPTCVVAAVAARKMRAPVAVHHERCDDMSSGGHRAPVSATWSCAIDPASGVINSCHMHLEYDSGCVDGAAGDLGMAIQWSDNCYYHEDFACEGAIVLSPRVGNTAVRAPGVIQSIALHEFIIEAAAEATQRDAEEIREINLYKSGQTTPFGLALGSAGVNWLVPQLWQTAKAEWDVAGRRAQVNAFNHANAWRKRGLCMMPVKYNVSISGNDKPMPAAVRIFADDGSVQVVHGGTELGQGIHVKVAQAVAYALQCPLEVVSVGDTSSSETPNASDTGGSIGSETCVGAALDACKALVAALAPYRASAKDWPSLIAAAAKDSQPLSSYGWFVKEAHGLFDYATQGVCLAEAEVDALTGECQVRRVDIVMDQGTPLNPLVDLGQAEGGFVMALGFFLTEQVTFTDRGEQCTLGSWEYKVPGAHDLPLEMNFKFEAHVPNPAPIAVLGTKASGEPPMALGAAVALAVRDAIKAVRAEHGGATSKSHLVLPLTVERVAGSCGVSADAFVLQ